MPFTDALSVDGRNRMHRNLTFGIAPNVRGIMSTVQTIYLRTNMYIVNVQKKQRGMKQCLM